MESKGVIGIVGAGIVGCVSALAFHDRGYDVALFEMRSDPKSAKLSNLKSINLSLSNRGIRTLKLVNPELCDTIMKETVPLYGRMIHDLKGNEISQKYGLFGEYNNSIDRGLLNQLLIEEVKQKGIKVFFNHKLVHGENFDNHPKLVFSTNGEEQSYDFDYAIGADGAFSQFRYQMQKQLRMNFSQNFIDMQYMELFIPPNNDASATSKYRIDPNHLHIWPREDFMLIALANGDGSFTSTFFSPWSVIEGMKTSDEFVDFFQKNFPDGYELLGREHLVDAFDNKPRGALVQISSYPYHSPTGKALIIGDAAHSMVPFYGQGLNCGLEDVRILLELLDETGDLSEAFKTYSPSRRDDLTTICKLAMDNYNEMASKVTKTSFLLRKKLDYYFGKYANGVLFPWIPMYSMISFRDDINYSKAVAIENRQSKILHYLQIGLIGTVALGVYHGVKWYERLARQ
ncbi:kynurenine 3-monooxygenase [[Candida] jaroonii]|uniref:Kynurenine 3-monooxygenase n=1 Tax=[Candida] jaroonii TaxID=467808 RepID=A0ACA9Y7I5_9ASCO|nr:kynurenine 3-monooxygenase [[Candida] jaroonii]